jgi:hypothetical protein
MSLPKIGKVKNNNRLRIKEKARRDVPQDW